MCRAQPSPKGAVTSTGNFYAIHVVQVLLMPTSLAIKRTNLRGTCLVSNFSMDK